MYVAKAENMRNIDKRAIEKYKIPGIVLMENAAWAVVKRIQNKNANKITVVCGLGNNGGDGFAIARLLYINGYDVALYFWGDSSLIKGDAKINYDILVNMGIVIKNNLEELKNDIMHSCLVVDALFGTGLNKKVEGVYGEVIDIINRYSKYTISVDIPSGIEADTGLKLGHAVLANETVTFGTVKLGLLINDGREHSGDIIIDNISIPKKCIEEEGLNITTNNGGYPKDILKKRNYDVNKGTCGKVAIVGGSYNMSGAVILSSKAALRTGSGLVCCAIPKSIVDRVGSFLPEATYRVCDELDGYLKMTHNEIEDIIKIYDAISIGVGMGRDERLVSLLLAFLNKSTKPLVIDADGLNLLCSIKEDIKKANCPIVLTPHPAEMSRLTGYDVEYINKKRVDVARDFAKEYKCIVLLKGASTVVSNGETTYINTTGNAGMATGGSGDVLTGIIVSLIGQGYSPYESAVLGAYIHGLSGDLAYKKYGYGLIASDILECVGKFIK